jgi:hypothetical protein
MTRRSLKTTIWSDPWFESLTTTEKLVWIYLLTNNQCNLLGIYEMSAKKASFEIGIKQTDYEKALKAFTNASKVLIVDSWVCILNHLKNQKLNPNMVLNSKKLFENLPEKVKNALSLINITTYEMLSNGSKVFANALESYDSKHSLSPSISTSISISTSTSEPVDNLDQTGNPKRPVKNSNFVLMSDREIQLALENYKGIGLTTEDMAEGIQILDAYLANNKKKRKEYTSHYHVMIGWVQKEVIEKKTKVLTLQRNESYQRN